MSLPINTALAAFYYPAAVVICLTISCSLYNCCHNVQLDSSFKMLCSYLRIECLYLFLLTFAIWLGKAIEHVARVGGTMLIPTASHRGVLCTRHSEKLPRHSLAIPVGDSCANTHFTEGKIQILFESQDGAQILCIVVQSLPPFPSTALIEALPGPLCTAPQRPDESGSR